MYEASPDLQTLVGCSKRPDGGHHAGNTLARPLIFQWRLQAPTPESTSRSSHTRVQSQTAAPQHETQALLMFTQMGLTGRGSKPRPCHFNAPLSRWLRHGREGNHDTYKVRVCMVWRSYSLVLLDAPLQGTPSWDNMS
jgi:hypothetical protein